jgi:hypothetical protein|tara:strand:- start:1364 stop:1636 length:273 start_codon:yes stop_codon:yes gene_type:complete
MVAFMETILLLMYVVLLRLLFFIALNKFRVVRSYSLVAFILFAAFAVPLPLVMIKKEIISNSVFNISIAGLSLFYFAFVVSAGLSRLKRY